MKILSAIGWGVLLILLKFIVPALFAGFQNTLLAFFNTLQSALALGKSGMQAGAVVPNMIPSVSMAP